MNAPIVATERTTPRPLWAFVAIAIGLWLLGCFLVGLAIASASGEHGSILFVMFGLAIGISGGVSHALLLLVPCFRKLRLAKQVLSVWAGTVALLLLFAAYSSAQSERPYVSAFAEALGIVLLYCALPALMASAIVSSAVKNAA